jgi:hypothetical protein
MPDTDLNNVLDAASMASLVIPGAGEVVAGALQAVKTGGALFTRDPARSVPDWDEANAVATPAAIAFTDALSSLSNEQLTQIVSLYSAAAVKYISYSQHASQQTNVTYVNAIIKEVPATIHSRKYQYAPLSQLFYLTWLHAMWSYGNFGRDEIKSGFAASEFYKQLQATLFPAVVQVAPSTKIPAPNTPTTPNSGGSTADKNANAASIFSNVWVALAFAGAFILVLLKFGKGK